MPLLLLFIALIAPISHAEEFDPYNVLQWKQGDSGDWYEWWYYKVVEPETGEAFYFTYGVVNPGKANGKGILQVGSFGQKVVAEQQVPLAQFSASRSDTDVRIGANTATDKRITGSLKQDDGEKNSWDLSFEKDWKFLAMGWGMQTPDISNIFWYPAQASASATGTVHFRGKTYSFVNAPAYQDRNWGRSFPDWWTWMVSNNFEHSPGTTLAVGGGKPRVFNGPALFSGLCIGLRYQGEEYVFRTTDGNVVTFDIKWGKWEVSATNGYGKKIEISAYAPPEKFMLLPFSTPLGKTFYDYEALTGDMTVKLSSWTGFSWKTIATLVTHQAGIEWGSPDPVGMERIFGSK